MGGTGAVREEGKAMGLHIHSLGELPLETERDYYVYLLDHGWDEPLGEALRENFHRAGGLASRHEAVAMMGTVGSHFADEVLSWHHVNGQPADDLLPAVLITTRHPRQFRDAPLDRKGRLDAEDFPMLLIPLDDVCETPTDVARLIERIFTDVKGQAELSEFRIAQELRAGQRGAIVDSVILRPNVGGIGVDLTKLLRRFQKKRAKKL